MAQQYYNQNQFNAGQLSPKLRRRSDFQGYQSGLKECTNFLPQVHGPLTKRPGTRRVGNTQHNSDIRLIPFVFSADTVYVLEFSNLKMRVYKDGLILGAPFTLTTTITSAMLSDLQYTQNGDVMYLVHEDLAPQELVRISDTSWTINALGLTPEPTYEAGGEYGVDTTLGATSGTSVNYTADSGTPWLRSDVGRFLKEVAGPGFAVIKSYTSTSILVVDILTTFSTTDLNDGDWRILGSPNADIWFDKIGPPGTTVEINIHNDIDDTANSELISNGDFSSTPGLTNWDNRSRPQVYSGSVTGTSDGDTNVIDTSASFITDGVQENYLAINTTQGTEEYISAIQSENEIVTETGKAQWATSDTFTVNQTGSAFVDANDKLILNGQRNGIGWVEQDVASLTANRIYALKFRVEDAPVSLQVGSASKDSDVLGELSYGIGEHEVYFWNDYTTLYVQLRNNQFTNASVSNISMRLVSVGGFRSGDVGKYIRTLGGLVEITAYNSSSHVTGIIRADLVSAEDQEDVREVAGVWSLESAAWTSTLGYPRVVALHDQRLFFGSTATFPTRVWGSVIGDFGNFNRGEANDDDAIIINPTSTEVNEFRWMMSEHNLAIGTGHDEFIITGGLEGAFTPTQRRVLTPSHWGSIVHRPLRVGNVIIFVERNGTAVRAMQTTEEGNVTSNTELTLVADGIADAGIKRIVWQQRPTPTIWAVLEDGNVISGVFDQNQEVTGWVQHDFKGYVHDIVVIPDGVRDQIWVAVRRVTGTSIEYFQEEDAVFGKLVTDSTYVYDSTETDEITGLYWLEGKEVAIVSNNGVEYPNQIVNCGMVNNLFPQVTYAEVGLPIEGEVIFLRPEDNSTPTVGYTINAIKVSLSLYESSGGALDGQSLYTVFEWPFDVDDTTRLYTGILPLHGINSDGKLPELVLTHDEAKPFSLQAITYLIESSSL